MQKIELQDVIDACEEAESEYIKLFRPLLGYEDEISLNVGIDDSMEEILDEIEEKIGMKFPADFLQLYLICNGGKYFDINLYYLTNDKDDPNGLYAKNFDSKLREEYGIPEGVIIVGETMDGLYILLGIDEEGYYTYYIWDKESKSLETELAYLIEALIYEIDYYTQAFSIDEDVVNEIEE